MRSHPSPTSPSSSVISFMNLTASPSASFWHSRSRFSCSCLPKTHIFAPSSFARFGSISPDKTFPHLGQMNDCLAAIGVVAAANQETQLRQILGHHADRALSKQYSSRQPPGRHRPVQKHMFQHPILAPAEPVTLALVVQQLVQCEERPLQGSRRAPTRVFSCLFAFPPFHTLQKSKSGR